MNHYIVKNKEEFENSVFGGEELLKNHPEILSTGVKLLPINGFYYILNKENLPVSDCSFFSKNEMQYLQKI